MSQNDLNLKNSTDTNEINKQLNWNMAVGFETKLIDKVENFENLKKKFKIIRFMITSAIKLKLEDLTLATATTIFHKFFKLCNMSDFDPYLIATASIYLAIKSEEQDVKLRDIINVCHRTLHPELDLLKIDENYWSIRKSVIQIELLIVRVLKFKLEFDHPHKYLLVYLDSLREWIPLINNLSPPIPETSWHVLRDLLHSDILIRYKAQDIAVSIIYFISLCYGVKIPYNQQAKNTWWNALNDKITKNIINEIITEILNVYELETLIGDLTFN